MGFKRLYPADESIFEDLVLRSTQNLDRAALQVTPAQDGSVFQDELILYLCILRDGITLEGKVCIGCTVLISTSDEISRVTT